MFSALSLGLPRRSDLRTITDSQIDWAGSNFKTEVASKHGTNRLVLATALITGRLTLGTNGLPISADIPAVGDVAACSVIYEYADSNAVLPSIFTIKYPSRRYRFEFLSLKLGTNDLTGTGGYAPSSFADMKLDRHVTLWTNDRPYSLINGEITPAFRPPPPEPGKQAPALLGSTWFNTAHSLTWEGLRGKVVLLDFWGMWCPPCVKGLPHVQAQHTKFKDRGLVVIGIHTAWGTEKNLETFLKDHGITFPVAVDREIVWEGTHAGATMHPYVLDDLPSYALVDRSGNLVWKSSSGVEPTETQIEQLLGGASPK
jgi:thiol-disulfide isomerase/thioredoxin